MTRLKILIITPFFPYRKVHHAGGKLTYEIIKGLAVKHDIYLFSRIEPHEVQFLSEMKSFCKDIKIFRFKPPHGSNPLSAFMILLSYIRFGIQANRIISDQNFNIVHIEHTQTGLVIRKPKHALMALIAHDVIMKPAKRRYLDAANFVIKYSNWIQYWIVKKIEPYIVRKFDIIFTLSRMDKDILLEACSELNIDIMPYPVQKYDLKVDISRKPNAILFAGAMHRIENVQAVLFLYQKVFPFIQSEFPEVELYIVGNSPPLEIRELTDKSGNVVVTGFVENLSEYYEQATIFVSPLFTGGGIIVKNLDAMAHGLPVVTTTIGNEGIEAVDGRDVLIADTAEEFVQAILHLLKTPDKRKEIGSKGREYIVKHYNIESVLEKIEKTYERLQPGNIDNYS